MRGIKAGMFVQLRMWRGAALVLVLLLSACGAGAQTPVAPSLIPASPVPTAVVALPSATVAQQPSPIPSPTAVPTAPPPAPTAVPAPPTAVPATPEPAPTAVPAPPTAVPAPPSRLPQPAPAAPDPRSSPSCIPSEALLPGLPTVSES